MVRETQNADYMYLTENNSAFPPRKRKTLNAVLKDPDAMLAQGGEEVNHVQNGQK